MTTHDFLIGGVILSPIVPELAAALAITGLISVLAMRLGLFRFVWHRPLVEVALFCIILGIIVMLTPDGWPVWGTHGHFGATP